MKSQKFRRLALAITALAPLAVPAGATAHPSVWQTTAKVAGPAVGGVVPTTDRVSYVVSNHGFTMVFNETNGQTANGMMNFRVLPSAYRNQGGFTLSRLLAEGDTGVQPHATCRGTSGPVTALWTPEAIAAWQSQTPATPAKAEPFYNYVPWQKTAAGLDDEVDIADWVAVVKDRTGVDLASTTDLAAACAGIGGTLVPADAVATTTASLNSGYAAQVVAPLNTQITSLVAQVAGLQADLTVLSASKEAALTSLAAATQARDEALGNLATANSAKLTAQAEVANLKRTLGVSTASPSMSGGAAASSGVPVSVAGPAGNTVAITLTIGSSQARSLKVASTVIGTANGTIGSGGSSNLTVAIPTSVKPKLRSLRTNLGITITATSADRMASKALRFTP